MRKVNVMGLGVFLAICDLGVGACGLGTQPDDLLRQRRSELESVATQWARGTSSDFFFFSKESWRWNGRFIEHRNDKYVVSGVREGEEILTHSFEDAALAVGSTERELSGWNKRLADLHLRGIVKIDDAAIELNVEGFRRRAYGLLYVLPSHETTLAEFLADAQKGKVEGLYQDIRHLEGRWFYVFGE